MLIENIIYAIITTAILYAFINTLIDFVHSLIIKKNTHKALMYSQTNLSQKSKNILKQSEQKHGYITSKAIKKLELNIDKENVESLIEDFHLRQAEAKETVKTQKFPTCFDHLNDKLENLK